MKKNTNINVNIPNEILHDMEIHATVVSPVDKKTGILILTSGMKHFTKEIVIRIYLLHREDTKNHFDIQHELQAFSFTSYLQAKKFLNHLPNMSALEMLVLLKPSPQFQ
ncbi:hypothetical protein SAMN05192533_102309 [Mesobacillus persicus]|uniref:Uncharacterized protein n=1 Tax=Mesobacillus persicus TaxID=930146 RepID=A0A1H7XRP5_9BACI|nr:hypothetical protein [Mesobacillus persicus]SEM35807.1 hypothetical protein SAMN05192533_102309 [Mesobacillus persicus]